MPPDRSRCRDMYLGLVWLMIQVRREMLSKALMGPCRKEDATEETTSATPALHPIPDISSRAEDGSETHTQRW